MADAGFSSDYLLVRELIQNGKTLEINKDDCHLDKLIKAKINDVIVNDIVTKHYDSSMKYEYYWHTAYNRVFKLMIKINRIRQRNWYFKKLTV